MDIVLALNKEEVTKVTLQTAKELLIISTEMNAYLKPYAAEVMANEAAKLLGVVSLIFYIHECSLMSETLTITWICSPSSRTTSRSRSCTLPS